MQDYTQHAMTVANEVVWELNRDDVAVQVNELQELGCCAVTVICAIPGGVHADNFLVDSRPRHTSEWIRNRILLIVYNLTER